MSTMVAEYFRGTAVAWYRFDTLQEAEDFITRQGEEPGVEWTVVEE